MPKLFLLFNHTITELQENDAWIGLGVEKIVSPPSEIRDIWGRIPVDAGEIDPFLGPVKKWLTAYARPGDFVLIQGDFGACFLMAVFAMDNGFVPLYSTTRRLAAEELQADGRVRLIHHFRHERFRHYGV